MHLYSRTLSSTQQNLTSLAPGSYDVTVTDAMGCEGIATGITASGGTPAYTYAWSVLSGSSTSYFPEREMDHYQHCCTPVLRSTTRVGSSGCSLVAIFSMVVLLVTAALSRLFFGVLDVGLRSATPTSQVVHDVC